MSFKNQLHSQLGSNVKYLSELNQNVLRSLLQLAVKVLEHDKVPEGALEKISRKFEVDQTLIDRWYSAIFTIVKLHIRCTPQPISQTEMKNFLNELKFSPVCIEDIIVVLYGPKRNSIITNFSNRLNCYPKIDSIKWKINIEISSSVLRKIMEPYVVMEWTLSNGEKQIFQLSVQKFHQLRQLIAKLLLEVIVTENIKSFKSLHHE